MDDITHVLLGIFVTLVMCRDKKGIRLAFILCAIIASLVPDIDILLRLFGEGVYLMQHRGFTHSVLGLFSLSLLIAYVFSLRYPKDFKRFFDVSFMCIALHIFADLATSWGTLLLWPYMKRFSLDWMFIIDPYLLFILIAGLGIFFALKRPAVLYIAFIAVVLHYGFLAYFHSASIDISSQQGSKEILASLPTFGQPLIWRIIAQENGTYVLSDLDLLSKDMALIATEPIPDMSSMDAQRVVPDLDSFLRFSRFPYAEQSKNSTIWYDLMFYGRQFMGVEVIFVDGEFHGKFRSAWD